VKLFADDYILHVADELSRCANLAAMNLAGFFDAFDQFVEELLLHLNTEDTSIMDDSIADPIRVERAKARFTIQPALYARQSAA